MPLLLLSSSRKLSTPLTRFLLHQVIVVIIIIVVVSSTVSSLSLPSADTTKSLGNMMMGPYCLNVKMGIRPDQRETFLSLIKEDQEQSLTTEPECLQFVVGEDINKPNIFYLHEEYKTMAGFQYHSTTPHFHKWNTFCKTNPWLNNNKDDDDDGGEPVVEFYHGTHTATTDKWPRHDDRVVYCLNVNLYVKPQVRDEFLNVIANNKIGSDNQEPLCLQYVYGESTETPNLFHFHEQYTGNDDGNEGFTAHTQAPHFAAWEMFANTGEPFSKPPVVNFFKTVH
jgi:quinol monooxygenase YgiN